MLWGMASDRFGRRPILLLGPLGLFIATLCFGLSTQYRELIIFRSIQGAFNGNIGMSRLPYLGKQNLLTIDRDIGVSKTILAEVGN